MLPIHLDNSDKQFKRVKIKLKFNNLRNHDYKYLSNFWSNRFIEYFFYVMF